jgi:ethanolamine ammonia-lyase small subunit
MAEDRLTPFCEELPDVIAAVRQRTPARVLAGRAGSSYRTPTLLGLRHDHAAARDAVWAEVDLARDLGRGLVERFGLFEVQTRANSKEEYLLRPDLGRRLCDAGRDAVAASCPTGAELQAVIGDGLSAAAVAAQVPALLPLLDDAARAAGWRVGRPFFVRYCRVGVLNDVGELLDPEVVVLLVGERPGLATAESLSAYMAYRPRPGHSDANRNLISNVHARGVLPAEAAARVVALAAKMRRLAISGVALKEERPALAGPGVGRLIAEPGPRV